MYRNLHSEQTGITNLILPSLFTTIIPFFTFLCKMNGLSPVLSVQSERHKPGYSPKTNKGKASMHCDFDFHVVYSPTFAPMPCSIYSLRFSLVPTHYKRTAFFLREPSLLVVQLQSLTINAPSHVTQFVW